MEITLEHLLEARPRIAFARTRQFAEKQPPIVDTATPELEDHHREELAEWQAKAAQGDDYAQWMMGRAAEKNLITPGGPEAADGWYRQAAAGGSPQAINDLAVALHRRCDPDPALGDTLVAEYEKAADGCVAEALCNLGLVFHHYRGYTGRHKGNVFFEEAQAEGVAEAAALLKENQTGLKVPSN